MSKGKKANEHEPATTADPPDGSPTCVLVALPTEKDRVESAARAVEINPQNAPSMAFWGLIGGVLPPGQLAVLTGKKWGAKVDLGVSFMDTTDTTLINRILSHANVWGEDGNIRFRHSQSGGEIRVARQASGYWSYLGIDALSIPSNQPTLNLQSFSMATPESEYRRVVRHEFGHALGFPHEHQRSEIIGLLDFNKTAAEFRRLYGWSAATVREQIFEPLSPGEIQANDPDAMSIMCYQFSGNCTKSGQPIPGGLDLDPADRKFVAVVYPKDVVPPGPPPPPPVDASGKIAFDLSTKTITAPAGWKLTPAAAGEYVEFDLSGIINDRIRGRAAARIKDAIDDADLGGAFLWNGDRVSGVRPPGMEGVDWADFLAFIMAIFEMFSKMK